MSIYIVHAPTHRRQYAVDAESISSAKRAFKKRAGMSRMPRGSKVFAQGNAPALPAGWTTELGLPQAESVESATLSTLSPDTAKHCPRCGSSMVLRKGRFGPFYGCSQFPRCKGTRKVVSGAPGPDDDRPDTTGDSSSCSAQGQGQPAQDGAQGQAQGQGADADANSQGQGQDGEPLDGESMAEMVEQALNAAVEQAYQQAEAKVEAQLQEKLEQALAEREATITVERGDDVPDYVIDNPPDRMALVLELLVAGMHPLLIGPTGCGKTYLAERLAEALGVPYFHMGALTLEHQLLGYTVGAEYVSTPLRACVDPDGDGGLILLDEIDAYWPQPALALNSVLSNGYVTFPDAPEPIRMNPRSYIIAAANTWGHGADREYVGRNQLDAATLRRFVPVEVDYSERVERALAGPFEDWVALVHHVRARTRELGLRHYVTTDEVIRGRKLLERGNLSVDEVTSLLLRRDLDEANWNRVIEGSAV